VNPHQVRRLERIKNKVAALDRILEECEERSQWQKHYGDSQFFKRLSSSEVQRLRGSLEVVITELEHELRDLWSELQN